MKKLSNLKALLLSFMLVACLVLPMSAKKSDGFFRNNDNYENRTDGIDITDDGGISNYGIGETVPLGSGWLILAAFGAGYALVRRKSNKGVKAINALNAIIILSLLLNLTSCKKNLETTNTAATNGVFITFDVDGDSKVIVNPTGHINPNYATVTFESGDIIYVGNNGAYSGYLQHNGTNFSGTITPTSENDYLHFYFMGNKGTTSQPTSVSITDQTSKYPVISYAHSTKLYKSGMTSYSARLQNYCAIVKFTTTNIPQATAITITGMNNTVEINFGANNAATSTIGEPYSFSKTGKGNITIHAESNTERLAILLPQGEVEPYYSSLDPLTWKSGKEGGYTWASYRFENSSNHDGSSFSKYTGSDYSVLQPEDDVATHNWGANWRMPTNDELQELFDNTDKEWTTINGINGFKFKKKTDASVYIFFPSAGGFNGTTALDNNTDRGECWSSTDNTSTLGFAKKAMFNSSGSANAGCDGWRDLGRPVRPVRVH